MAEEDTKFPFLTSSLIPDEAISGRIICVSDPSYMAVNCCGENNRGTHEIEGIHYCFNCGNGFRKLGVKDNSIAEEFSLLSSMARTMEALREQGLLDEFFLLQGSEEGGAYVSQPQ